ncbi:MAG: prolyl oligopeptidase family serine peptidase [Verrucomicrobiales bacterium]|nr:prolyl oligopeptidase family serine peptidase [Verrucomicrobiales bacterium]
MKILPLLLAGLIAPAFLSAADFEKSAFTGKSGKKLKFALLQPETVKDGEKYPLVITLHGVGGRGKTTWTGNCAANGVLAKPEMRKKYPCFVMAPTCAKAETWQPVARLRGEGRLPDVFELIEKLLKDHPIDPKRVYVTGQSMGGFGTFGAVGQRPDLFAAAAPVCGGYDPSKAEKFAKIPIWIFHGEKDTTVPVSMSREMVEALKKAGGEPNYTEFPGVGHNSWTPAYAKDELWEWLFAREKS